MYRRSETEATKSSASFQQYLNSRIYDFLVCPRCFHNGPLIPDYNLNQAKKQLGPHYAQQVLRLILFKRLYDPFPLLLRDTPEQLI